MKALVEWVLYAGAWEIMFRNGVWIMPETRGAAIDIIQGYEEA